MLVSCNAARTIVQTSISYGQRSFQKDCQKDRRTLHTDSRANDDRGSQQQVILHLASRRLPEVRVAEEEHILEAIHVRVLRRSILIRQHVVQHARDVLARLLLEHRHDIAVQKLERVVALVDSDAVQIIREVEDL